MYGINSVEIKEQLHWYLIRLRENGLSKFDSQQGQDKLFSLQSIQAGLAAHTASNLTSVEGSFLCGGTLAAA